MTANEFKIICILTYYETCLSKFTKCLYLSYSVKFHSKFVYVCVCVCVHVCLLPYKQDVTQDKFSSFPSPRLAYYLPITGEKTDGSVSLFNGMSTLVGYSMPKPSLWKNSSDTI